MDSEIVSAIKQRYAALPPLLVACSVERATSNVELFDILDSVPSMLPVVWNNELRQWITTQLISPPDELFVE